MDATRCLDDLDPDFKYKHSNDSHSWIIDYPASLKADPQTLKISAKNEDYAAHEVRRQKNAGRRKKLMEAFYRKVISEEIMGQFEEDNVAVVEEYLTDYMDRFKNPDDMPLPGETLSRNEKLKKENLLPNEPSKSPEDVSEELKSKYPLYFSAPLTFFGQATGRCHFRKNSTITKRPEENYDNMEY